MGDYKACSCPMCQMERLYGDSPSMDTVIESILSACARAVTQIRKGEPGYCADGDERTNENLQTDAALMYLLVQEMYNRAGELVIMANTPDPSTDGEDFTL